MSDLRGIYIYIQISNDHEKNYWTKIVLKYS